MRRQMYILKGFSLSNETATSSFLSPTPTVPTNFSIETTHLCSHWNTLFALGGFLFCFKTGSHHLTLPGCPGVHSIRWPWTPPGFFFFFPFFKKFYNLNFFSSHNLILLFTLHPNRTLTNLSPTTLFSLY